MTDNYKNIEPNEYLKMLDDLLEHGQLCNKTSPRYVHKWPTLKLCTEDDNKAVETTVSFDPDIYILFDPHVYGDKAKRRAVLGQIINSFSTKLHDQADLNAPDWQGADVYTMTGDKFRADYDIDPKNLDTAHPNADAVSALRLCLDVKESVNWPCTWGDFPIGKGGTIAMSQSDVDDLEAVVNQLHKDLKDVDDVDVRNAAIQQALYQDGGNAKFDIYGMKPGFRIKNYDLYDKKSAGKNPTSVSTHKKIANFKK